MIERRVVRTVMTMLTYEDEILLLFHDKCHSWMGPGGKIESDELVCEAAVRELKEEAGITIDFNHESLTCYPHNNARVRKCPLPMTVLTYVGYQGPEYWDLLEDQVFWWEVPKEVRDQPLIAHEGHEIAWFKIREVLHGHPEKGYLTIQPEVLETVKEIARHPIKQAQRFLTR